MEDVWYGRGCHASYSEEPTGLVWKGPLLQPDVFAYSMVANAYAKAGMGKEGAKAAEEVLQRLLTVSAEYEKCPQKDGNGCIINIYPSAHLFSAIILAHKACGDGQSAEAVLQRLDKMFEESGKDKRLAPDTHLITGVIDAWANSRPEIDSVGDPVAVVRVESLLRRLEEAPKDGSAVGPNVYSYTAAMKCMHRHLPGVAGAMRAEGILWRMVELYEDSGDELCKPNSHSYVTCMNAWAKSGGGIDAAERADSMLVELDKQYVEKQDSVLEPTTAAFTCCIDAWSRSGGGTYASERTLELFDRMVSGRPGSNIRPNSRAYTAAISTIAKSDSVDVADRAISMLRKVDSPDTAAYAAAIIAVAQSGLKDCALKAYDLLQEMHIISTQSHRPRFWKPCNEVSYAAVIHAHTKSRDPCPGAAQNCVEVLRLISEFRRSRVSRGLDRVTPFIFVDVINFVLRAGVEVEDGAVLLAEDVIEIMKETVASSHGDTVPLAVYTSTIDAFVKTKRLCAGEKAEDLYNFTEAMASQGRCSKPDARLISSVLEAILLGEGEDASNAAEDFLRRLINLNSKADISYLADTSTVARVASFISKNDKSDTAERVLGLLKLVEDSESEKIKPNKIMYNVVIDCLAKNQGQVRGAVAKMKELFQSMEQAYAETGDDHIKPDIVTFGSLLYGLSQSKDGDAAIKAESMLEHLEGVYARGDQRMKPNSFVFNAVIATFARSSDKGSADKAERLLMDMESKYLEGDKSLRPGLDTYTNVILGHVNSREKGGAEKAEQILVRQEKKVKAGDEDAIELDLVCYGAVINCLCRSRKTSSYERAEALLSRMIDLTGEGRNMVKPDFAVFGTVMKAWAKSADTRKADKTLKLLRKAQGLFNGAGSEMGILGYNWAIYAAATSTGDEDERKHFFANALELFRDAQTSKSVTPNSYTYTFFVKACTTLLPEGEQRDSLVKGAFEVACKRGQLDRHVISVVTLAIPGFVADKFNVLDDMDSEDTTFGSIRARIFDDLIVSEDEG